MITCSTKVWFVIDSVRCVHKWLMIWLVSFHFDSVFLPSLFSIQLPWKNRNNSWNNWNKITITTNKKLVQQTIYWSQIRVCKSKPCHNVVFTIRIECGYSFSKTIYNYMSTKTIVRRTQRKHSLTQRHKIRLKIRARKFYIEKAVHNEKIKMEYNEIIFAIPIYPNFIAFAPYLWMSFYLLRKMFCLHIEFQRYFLFLLSSPGFTASKLETLYTFYVISSSNWQPSWYLP